MKSAVPKVLHEIAGRSLLNHVVEAAARTEPEHLIVVVGHGAPTVVAHLEEVAPWVTTVEQTERNGTGHAVRIALEALSNAGVLMSQGPIVVLTGDTPLLTGETLQHMLSVHEGNSADATILTAELANPFGYGRILRDGSHVTGIVEQRDATDDQKLITEINSGMYAFASDAIIGSIGLLTSNNSQGEEYLTDVIGLISGNGGRVTGVMASDSNDILGINDRAQLAEAGSIMRDRINRKWMQAGVTMVDPGSTWLDVDVEIAPDVTLLPQTILRGPTSIESGAQIGPGTTLISCEVGEAAVVRHTWAELAVVGSHATVGPYTYLRPGTDIGARGKAGAFVEIKNSQLGEETKVPHLSYVGDATIGPRTNIGAGTVVVNYDGVEKHRTVIGEAVRVGSDNMLVAPVEIGDGAYTAAGSVITEDVPPGAMAVGRATQRNIPGWVARKRPGTTSAAAAERAGAQTEPGSDKVSSKTHPTKDSSN
jgi:bifunctional UDP-N-acetylglucosamine pyrophosphorylase/glucosamine-1-phosphate N-acetyltransferase